MAFPCNLDTTQSLSMAREALDDLAPAFLSDPIYGPLPQVCCAPELLAVFLFIERGKPTPTTPPLTCLKHSPPTPAGLATF